MTPEIEAALQDAGLCAHLIPYLPREKRDRAFVAMVARGIEPSQAAAFAFSMEGEKAEVIQDCARSQFDRREIWEALRGEVRRMASPLLLNRSAIEELVQIARASDNEHEVIEACRALQHAVGNSLSALVEARPGNRLRS